jgi:hypothetical protein
MMVVKVIGYRAKASAEHTGHDEFLAPTAANHLK